MSGRVGAEQTPDIETVLAEHAVDAKTPCDTACRCDRTWRKDADYRAHVAQALAPVLAAAVREARAAALRNPYDEDGYCEFCGNGSWKAHMPECSWADLRDAKAAGWDEGYTSGHSNAMRRMSDEPNAPTTPNPYRAGRIDVDAPEGQRDPNLNPSRSNCNGCVNAAFEAGTTARPLRADGHDVDCVDAPEGGACPAGHGSACCGRPDMCRDALRSAL